jgi:hypothetical protein
LPNNAVDKLFGSAPATIHLEPGRRAVQSTARTLLAGDTRSVVERPWAAELRMPRHEKSNPTTIPHQSTLAHLAQVAETMRSLSRPYVLFAALQLPGALGGA